MATKRVTSQSLKAELSHAIERLHGCHASFREAAEVHERFGDAPVWDGLIYVFDLEGHPKAGQCYAWAEERDEPPGRKLYTVLKVGPVDSPEKALRAAIIRDSKRSPQ